MVNAEHTLRDIASTLRNFFSAEEFSYKKGYLQDIRTDVKFLGIVLLIFLAVATNDFIFFTSVIAFSLVMVYLSKVSFRQYFSRFYLIPIFSLVVVLPWIFLKDGNAIYFYGMRISYDGIYYVVIFFTRVVACVSLISLLLFTTKMSHLAHSMKKLKIPSTFVTILVIVYRFLFTFLTELYNMLLGKESRTFTKSHRLENAKKFAGNFMARVLVKKENVYMAMKAKGFNGILHSYGKEEKWNGNSISFVILIASMVLLWTIIKL